MLKIYSAVFLLETVIGMFWSCGVEALLEGGSDLAHVAGGFAALFFGIALFEVPTGYIADLFGRKVSCLAGTVCMLIGFIFVGSNSFAGSSFAGLFISGIGVTMLSGARDAWFYKVCLSKKQNSKIEHFWLSVDMTGRVAMITGVFLGVQLLTTQPLYVWFSAATICVLAIVVMVFIESDHEHNTAHAIMPSKNFVSDRYRSALFLILLANFFFGIESGIRNLVYQPYIVEINAGNLHYLAYFQITLALVRIGGNFSYRYYFSRFKKAPAFVCVALVIFGLSELNASITSSYLRFLPLYMLGVFALGWYFPIRLSVLNSIIAERYRATILSIDSMLENLAAAIVCLLFLDIYRGTFIGPYWAIGGGALLVSGLTFALVAKKLKQEENYV